MQEGFRRWKKQFEAGAIKYTKDTGLVRCVFEYFNDESFSCSGWPFQVPTLIIDNTNRLTGTPEREALLADFQDSANDWADSGLATKVVFVSGTGTAEVLLSSSVLFLPSRLLVFRADPDPILIRSERIFSLRPQARGWRRCSRRGDGLPRVASAEIHCDGCL